MKKVLSWIFWPKPKFLRFSDVENLTLIIINLFPVFGVLLFNWKAVPILLLYYIEAVIGIIFQFLTLFTLDDHQKKSSFLLFNYIQYFLPLVFVLFILIIPLLLVLLASDEKQIWQSVVDMYFWVFVLFYLGNQIVFLTKNSKKSKHTKKNETISPMSGFSMFVGPLIILVLVLVINHTGEYQSYLIVIILVKTFWDLRSYLRKQPTASANRV